MEKELKDFKVDIIPMIHKTMSSAKESHDIAFGDNREMDDLLAGIFLNDATTHASTAHLYYLQNPDFGHYEFDDFFSSFDVYRDEILSNIRTKHSHQWTDIEYREFANSAKSLAELLDMNVEHIYKDL